MDMLFSEAVLNEDLMCGVTDFILDTLLL